MTHPLNPGGSRYRFLTLVARAPLPLNEVARRLRTGDQTSRDAKRSAWTAQRRLKACGWILLIPGDGWMASSSGLGALVEVSGRASSDRRLAA